MKKIGLCFILIIVILLAYSSNSYATFNPGGITPLGIDDNLSSKLGGVIGIIQIVGTGIAVIGVIYLGIRYMVSSIEEKADIKKKAIPYVIGAVIFFGATGILRLIADVAGWF